MTDMNKDYKSGYLFVDDLVGIGEPIPEELLKTMPSIKGKVSSGILVKANIKDFERVAGGLKDVRILRKRKEHWIDKRFCQKLLVYYPQKWSCKTILQNG